MKKNSNSNSQKNDENLLNNNNSTANLNSNNTTTTTTTSSKNKKKQQQQQQAAKKASIQLNIADEVSLAVQNSTNNDENNEYKMLIQQNVVDSTTGKLTNNNNNSQISNSNRNNESNNLEEVDLNQMIDLSDESQGSTTSSSSSSTSSSSASGSPLTNNSTSCLTAPLSSVTLLPTQQMHNSHQYPLIQPVHPIQTVQPYPNSSVQKQRNKTQSTNQSLQSMQALTNSTNSSAPIITPTSTAILNNNNNSNNQYQKQNQIQSNPISNVNINKQFLIEQQIRQELESELSSSSLSNNYHLASTTNSTNSTTTTATTNNKNNNNVINTQILTKTTNSSPTSSSSNDYHQHQHHHHHHNHHNLHNNLQINDLALDQDNSSLIIDKQAMLTPQSLDNTAIQKLVCEEVKSHLILDDKECLQVKSAQEFISLFRSNVASVIRQNSTDSSSLSSLPSSLSSNSSSGSSANDDKLVKCVSIFGNTGDGKSHTLNHTFFNGRNIFRTSTKQETCTMGVWCAYDSITNSLIFDTEGLLGTTTNENKRMRLLLKVLAISDVIIYRTRAERLHNDLFKFLADASTAYLKYFSKELKQAANKLKLDTISLLGPDCVIFHETQHTDILCDEIDLDGHERTVSHQLRDRFAKLDLSYNAFSSLEYVGTRTCFSSNNNLLDKNLVSTDFTKLAQTIRYLLRNNSVRPPRKLSSIFQVFKVLNDKFNGIITKNQISTFADEYFTCSSVCLSCGKRCQNSINHLKDGILHESSEKCHYDHQYDNKVYVCKLCHEAGKEVIVIPKTSASNDNSFIGIVKYTYSGYVLECPHHGIIFRSRQYWYGNPDPESVVRTELKHIWSGQQNNVGTSHNLSRKIIDNVSYLGESIQNISAKPANLAKQWMADRVAPTYWIPNSDIIECFGCKKSFDDLKERKHHCRGCGKGFCDKCSSKRKIIPWWSLTDKVRVCNSCNDKEVIEEPKYPNQIKPGMNNSNSGSTSSLSSLGIVSGNNDVIVRKVTETVQETFGLIGYATKIPLDVLKESARPSYWKPDSECIKCAICHKVFDELLLLHHCRSCGNGVCHGCSPHLKPVPSRGWETPVRVCNNCVSNEISN